MAGKSKLTKKPATPKPATPKPAAPKAAEPVADLPFNYENVLLRGALLPVEREAVIAAVADGADTREAAEKLGLPYDHALSVVATAAGSEAIIERVITAARTEFVVAGVRRLMGIVRAAPDTRSVVDAAKVLQDMLGMRSGKKPPALKRPSAAVFEKAVRDAGMS